MVFTDRPTSDLKNVYVSETVKYSIETDMQLKHGETGQIVESYRPIVDNILQLRGSAKQFHE